MGLPLRSKLLGQAAAKAKQRRFCVRCSARESGAGREAERVMGKADVREVQPREVVGDGSQEAPAPLTPASECQPRESAGTLVG